MKKVVMYVGMLMLLLLAGCEGDTGSNTLCQPCGNGVGCSEGETCRAAEGGGYYCFEYNSNGSIDGVCE